MDGIDTYPDEALGSTSGHDRRRLQNTNDGLSGGAVWCTGDCRCRNEPFRGGAKHSRARDCRLIEPWCCSNGAVVPGAGTTFGKPIKNKNKNKIWIFCIMEDKYFYLFWLVVNT